MHTHGNACEGIGFIALFVVVSVVTDVIAIVVVVPCLSGITSHSYDFHTRQHIHTDLTKNFHLERALGNSFIHKVCIVPSICRHCAIRCDINTVKETRLIRWRAVGKWWNAPPYFASYIIITALELLFIWLFPRARISPTTIWAQTIIHTYE